MPPMVPMLHGPGGRTKSPPRSPHILTEAAAARRRKTDQSLAPSLVGDERVPQHPRHKRSPPCLFGRPNQRRKGRKKDGWCGVTEGASAPRFMLTLIQTAKLNDIDPQAWLADVLARINDHNIHSLDQLFPWNWKTQSARLAA
jgi:hypothetical protein